MLRKALLALFASLLLVTAPASAAKSLPKPRRSHISCSITVGNPTLYSSVLSAVVTISCTGTANAIHVSGFLTKNSSIQGVPMGKDCSNASFCQLTLQQPASSGLWYAYGEGYWTDSHGQHNIDRKRSPDCVQIL